MLDEINFSIGVAVVLIAHKLTRFVEGLLIGDPIFVMVKLLTELAPILVEVEQHVLASVAVQIDLFAGHVQRRIAIGVLVKHLHDIGPRATTIVGRLDTFGTLTLAS